MVLFRLSFTAASSEMELEAGILPRELYIYIYTYIQIDFLLCEASPEITTKWHLDLKSCHRSSLETWNEGKPFSHISTPTSCSNKIDARTPINPFPLSAFALTASRSEVTVLCDGVPKSTLWEDRHHFVAPAKLNRHFTSALFHSFFCSTNCLQPRSWSKVRRSGPRGEFFKWKGQVCVCVFKG